MFPSQWSLETYKHHTHRFSVPFFQDKVLFCRSCWLGTCYLAKTSLRLIVLQCLSLSRAGYAPPSPGSIHIINATFTHMQMKHAGHLFRTYTLRYILCKLFKKLHYRLQCEMISVYSLIVTCWLVLDLCRRAQSQCTDKGPKVSPQHNFRKQSEQLKNIASQ